MMQVTIATKDELRKALRDWPITPMSAILFGGERFMWTTWGAMAKTGNLVIGLATVADEGEMGSGKPTLIGVMVLPDYRRRGIGTQLVRAVVDEARTRKLLPLLTECLSPSGLGLARSLSYGPEVLEVVDQTFMGFELP